MLLSKTDKFPNGLANSSGHLGKHIMAHMMASVFVTFDDRYINNFMGPSAQKHTIDDFNADNFDHSGPGLHPRRADLDRHAEPRRRPDRSATTIAAAARRAALGRRRIATSSRNTTRATAPWWRRPRTCPTPTRSIDLDPNVRDAWGLPAPRMTYDWRRPNELARVEFMQKKMEEIGRAMGAPHVWRAPVGARRAGRAPRGRHPHGQRSEGLGRQQIRPDLGHPNLFLVGSSTFPTMGPASIRR